MSIETIIFAIILYFGLKYVSSLFKSSDAYKKIVKDNERRRAFDSGYEVERIEDYSEKEKIVVNIEHRGGEFYAYDNRTQVFMAQGSTLLACMDRIEERFPNSNFALSEQTLKNLATEVAKASKKKGIKEQA